MVSFVYGQIFVKIFLSRHCFISITVTFIFNIIFTPKNTYSYCFIMIFFVLKMVPSISNCSISNCFISFFCSLKRFPISLTVVSSLSFSYMNRLFFIFIMLSSIFLSFSSLKCSIIVCYEKNQLFFSIKVYFNPLKIVSKYYITIVWVILSDTEVL